MDDLTRFLMLVLSTLDYLLPTAGASLFSYLNLTIDVNACTFNLGKWFVVGYSEADSFMFVAPPLFISYRSKFVIKIYILVKSPLAMDGATLETICLCRCSNLPPLTVSRRFCLELCFFASTGHFLRTLSAYVSGFQQFLSFVRSKTSL